MRHSHHGWINKTKNMQKWSNATNNIEYIYQSKNAPKNLKKEHIIYVALARLLITMSRRVHWLFWFDTFLASPLIFEYLISRCGRMFQSEHFIPELYGYCSFVRLNTITCLTWWYMIDDRFAISLEVKIGTEGFFWDGHKNEKLRNIMKLCYSLILFLFVRSAVGIGITRRLRRLDETQTDTPSFPISKPGECLSIGKHSRCVFYAP